MTVPHEGAGTAALAIVEGLLLALNDRDTLPELEIVGILQDAADARDNADANNGDANLNTAVAALINKNIHGGNSVRRPKGPIASQVSMTNDLQSNTLTI